MEYNIRQKEAIETIEGPVLIIAGPGTGKTFTLVERVLNIINNKNIDPSEILISTFTNKASIELLDRLSIKFRENGINKDVNDMLLGNFHSIARKILNEYLEYTPLKKGYIQIDDIEQKYLVHRNILKFREIKGYDKIIYYKNEVNDIVKIVNKVSEEGILERESVDYKDNIILNICKVYEDLLKAYNIIDFSHILLYTYKLLKENENVKKELNTRINYIMIDEYQDTNSVQEKILFELINDKQNICVVGDDDQSLYRFRGATVKNILKFKDKFENAKIINLNHNYRSEDSIIKFYSSYLNNLINDNPELKPFRYNKILFSDKISQTNRAIKRISENEEEWRESIFKTIDSLIKTDSINHLNEIAILVSSVNDPRILKLKTYLVKNGIDVYIPKNQNLMSKKEVKVTIGFIYYMFKNIINRNLNSRDLEVQSFLDNCYDDFYKEKLKYDDKEFDDFIVRMMNYLEIDKFQLNLYDILYRAFGYNPFRDYLLNEEKAKSVSRFLELIKSFSLINQMYYINNKNIDIFITRFFYDYIKFIKNQRISEFEEDVKIPDKNSISMMTIHASKGMEYPVVIMGSLWDKPFKKYTSKLEKNIDDLIQKNKNNLYEPENLIEKLDFYRKYYTGFSRAKDLLILSGYENEISEITEFKEILSSLDESNINSLDIEKGEIKENKVKNKYSYTTDISPYLKCPFEYYYTKVLRFTYPKTKSLFYGSIVHESIEYINREHIKGRELNKKIIKEIVFQIGRQKFKEGAVMLTEKDINKAFLEVLDYFENINLFGKIVDSELNISISKEDYILDGNVDMIYEKDGKSHIVDFKTGIPPKEDSEEMDSYINQINLYAYLYNSTKNDEISTVSLYFTNLDYDKKMYTFKFDESKNQKVLDTIEKTIKNIEKNNFFENKKCINEHSHLKFFVDKIDNKNGMM